jgi:hypothetical protein
MFLIGYIFYTVRARAINLISLGQMIQSVHQDEWGGGGGVKKEKSKNYK